jgi:hypothetical protein
MISFVICKLLRIFNPNPLKRSYNKAVRTALLALLLKEGWEVRAVKSTARLIGEWYDKNFSYIKKLMERNIIVIGRNDFRCTFYKIIF